MKLIRFLFISILFVSLLSSCKKEKKAEKEEKVEGINVDEILPSTYKFYKKVQDNKTCLKWFINKKTPEDQLEKVNGFTDRFKMFFKMRELKAIKGKSSCDEGIVAVCKMRFTGKEIKPWPKKFNGSF